MNSGTFVRDLMQVGERVRLLSCTATQLACIYGANMDEIHMTVVDFDTPFPWCVKEYPFQKKLTEHDRPQYDSADDFDFFFVILQIDMI